MVSGSPPSGRPGRAAALFDKPAAGLFPPPRPAGLVAALALVLATTGLVQLGQAALPEPAAPLILLTPVLIAAVAFGFWAGMVAAALAFGALNFLFTEPLYTFHITHAQDLIALLVFLFVAGLAGLLAGRLHDQAAAATSRAGLLAILSDLAGDLAAAGSEAEVLAAATRHLSALSHGPAAAFRAGDPQPLLLASHPDFSPDTAEFLAAERALRLNCIEPAAAEGWQGSRLTILPLAETSGGALALGHAPDPGTEGSRRAAAIAVLCLQTAAALQRLDFAARARAERQRAEAEATRSALLASLSHDLRTPLATILGAASALKDLGQGLPAEAQADLLTAIEEEAVRLNRHVSNLLQMTRLQSGLVPQWAWVDVADVAAAAAARARRAWPQAEILLALPQGLPMVRAEAGLLEQALFNLIENALRHGAPPLRLAASSREGQIRISLQDHGPGLKPALVEWLGSSDPRPPAGLNGLGLAVAKGIARVLGGRLTAEPAPSTLLFSLPVPPPNPGASLRSPDA